MQPQFALSSDTMIRFRLKPCSHNVRKFVFESEVHCKNKDRCSKNPGYLLTRRNLNRAPTANSNLKLHSSIEDFRLAWSRMWHCCRISTYHVHYPLGTIPVYGTNGSFRVQGGFHAPSPIEGVLLSSLIIF